MPIFVPGLSAGTSTGTEKYVGVTETGSGGLVRLYDKPIDTSPTDSDGFSSVSGVAGVGQVDQSLLLWPDTRPWTQDFVSEHTQVGQNNPNGYLSNSTLNVSDSATFRTLMLAKFTEI